MKKIKIMPEYGCSPLWLYDSINPAKNIDVSELPISDKLKKGIQIWADTYESTFDEAYPPNSGFPTKLEEAFFEFNGICIWEALQKEIGTSYSICYYSSLIGKTYDNQGDYPKSELNLSHYVVQTSSPEIAIRAAA